VLPEGALPGVEHRLPHATVLQEQTRSLKVLIQQGKADITGSAGPLDDYLWKDDDGETTG
jgi:hypothetical protein